MISLSTEVVIEVNPGDIITSQSLECGLGSLSEEDRLLERSGEQRDRHGVLLCAGLCNTDWVTDMTAPTRNVSELTTEISTQWIISCLRQKAQSRLLRCALLSLHWGWCMLICLEDEMWWLCVVTYYLPPPCPLTSDTQTDLTLTLKSYDVIRGYFLLYNCQISSASPSAALPTNWRELFDQKSYRVEV